MHQKRKSMVIFVFFSIVYKKIQYPGFSVIYEQKSPGILVFPNNYVINAN